MKRFQREARHSPASARQGCARFPRDQLCREHHALHRRGAVALAMSRSCTDIRPSSVPLQRPHLPSGNAFRERFSARQWRLRGRTTLIHLRLQPLRRNRQTGDGTVLLQRVFNRVCDGCANAIDAALSRTSETLSLIHI